MMKMLWGETIRESLSYFSVQCCEPIEVDSASEGKAIALFPLLQLYMHKPITQPSSLSSP